MATVEQLQARLLECRAELSAVSTAQSYSIAGRNLVRRNSKEIRDEIADLERRIVMLSRGCSAAPVFIQTR